MRLQIHFFYSEVEKERIFSNSTNIGDQNYNCPICNYLPRSKCHRIETLNSPLYVPTKPLYRNPYVFTRIAYFRIYVIHVLSSLFGNIKVFSDFYLVLIQLFTNVRISISTLFVFPQKYLDNN